MLLRTAITHLIIFNQDSLNHCLIEAIKVPVTRIFDEKLSHPWMQIKKKTIELFTSLHGSFDRADRGLVPMT